MLVKLTSVKVLDNKMKRLIRGGKSCADQCKDDCNSDDQLRVGLNGDGDNKQKGIVLPPVP